ncbi:MAG: hypothetical protein OXE87_16735 [Chloroflexi bacterium]|nr:hypothetical protein [Chloroflexota bacterium]
MLIVADLKLADPAVGVAPLAVALAIAALYRIKRPWLGRVVFLGIIAMLAMTLGTARKLTA